jgi:hypothetical protein
MRKEEAVKNKTETTTKEIQQQTDFANFSLN